jgi:hypothetical protein
MKNAIFWDVTPPFFRKVLVLFQNLNTHLMSSCSVAYLVALFGFDVWLIGERIEDQQR